MGDREKDGRPRQRPEFSPQAKPFSFESGAPGPNGIWVDRTRGLAAVPATDDELEHLVDALSGDPARF